MKYDVLISGGEVVDPGGGLRGRLDLGIFAGRIVEVAPALRAEDAHRVIGMLRDTDGNTVSAKRRLVTRMTLEDGRACRERPAE